MAYRSLLPLVLLVVACGSDPAPGGADAASQVDGGQVAAEVVSCPGAVAAEVGVTGGQYTPSSVTIAPGEIVRFTASGDHDMRSLTAGLFRVDFGQVGCVRFNAVQSHGFYCGAHGFTGTVVVEE